ncbi:MAG: SUF system Fe-S cluster assembly protein [Alphaproteobacteria bacterium]|nr:SUF system Fe-S cluster assembly protein [Alphaproteobacteria bacterium]
MTEAALTTPDKIAADISDMGERIIAQLKTVYDPEIPVNIFDLGLIYKVDVDPKPDNKYDVKIDMTLTTPNCPVAGQMPAMVQNAVAKLEEVEDVKVNLTFDPPWDKDRMTDEARVALNMF